VLKVPLNPKTLVQGVNTTMYIGIDVHKNSCYLTALDEAGNILEEKEIETEHMIEWVHTIDTSSKIAIEASTASKPLYHLMKEHKLNVLMAHPAGLRVIAESTQKTDKNDSFHLANLLRMNYLPCSYVPDETYERMRNLCRYRVSLGRKMTKIKNEIHALLTRNSIKMKQTDIFGKDGLDNLRSLHLNDIDALLLHSLLEELNYLIEKAQNIENIMAGQGKHIPEVTQLMTIPGIGYYSAMTILAEIGDITRFPNPKKLCNYAGLTPRIRDSGDLIIHGRISKKGSPTLRWILVSAAHTIIRCRKGNTKLRKFYIHLIRRGKAKQVAVVALAKKLLLVIYAMLAKKTKYDDGNEVMMKKKIMAMNGRAIMIPETNYLQELNRLKHKSKILGVG
jgi:transposase